MGTRAKRVSPLMVGAGPLRPFSVGCARLVLRLVVVLACALDDAALASLLGAAELLVAERGPCPAAVNLVGVVLATVAHLAGEPAASEDIAARARALIGAAGLDPDKVFDSGARPAATVPAGPTARFALRNDQGDKS